MKVSQGILCIISCRGSFTISEIRKKLNYQATKVEEIEAKIKDEQKIWCDLKQKISAQEFMNWKLIFIGEVYPMLRHLMLEKLEEWKENESEEKPVELHTAWEFLKRHKSNDVSNETSQKKTLCT